MDRIITVQTRKTMTDPEFEHWKNYLASFELLTQPQIESLCQTGKLVTLKNGTTATYTIEGVN